MAHHHILVEALGLLTSTKSIDDEITELMKKRISRLEAAEEKEEGKSNRALPKASLKRSSATLVGRALSLVENIKENEDKLGALLGGYLHVRGCYPSTEHENGCYPTSVAVDGGSASSQSVTVPLILSTGGPSSSLQEIVDAARPGDVVVLRPGVYTDQPLRITVPFLTIRGGGGGPPLHAPKEEKKGTARGRERRSSSVNSDPKDDFYYQLRVKGLGRASRRSYAGTSSSSRVATDGNQKNVVEDDDDEDVVFIPKHKTVLHNTTTKAAINICAVGVRIENITIYQSGREAPAVVFNIASPSLSTPLSPLSTASPLPNRSNRFVEQGKTAHPQEQQQSFSYRDPLSKMSAEHTTSKPSLSQQSGCRTNYNTSATTADHADNNTTSGGCGSTAKDDLLYESLRATRVLATPPLKLPLPFTIIDESTVELITPIYNENEENINNINDKSNNTCKEARLLQIVEDRSVLMLRDCDIVSVSCHAVHAINTLTHTYAYTCIRDGQGEGVGGGGVGTRETRRGETATRWINTKDQQTERDQMMSLRTGEQHEEEGMLQLVDCRVTSYGGVGIQIGLAGAGKKGRAKMRDLDTSSSSRTRTLVLNTTDGVVESPFSLVSPSSSSSSSPFTLRTSSQSPTVEGEGYGPQVSGVLISNIVFGYCGLSAIVLSDTAECSYFHVSGCDMRGGCGQHGIHFTAAVACGSSNSNQKNITRAHVPLTSKGGGRLLSNESSDKDKKTLSDGATSSSGCNDAVSGSGVYANTVTERWPTRCARAVIIAIEDTIIRSPTLCGILIDEGRVVSCVLRTTAVLTEERSVGIYVHPNASLLTASNNVL